MLTQLSRFFFNGQVKAWPKRRVAVWEIAHNGHTLKSFEPGMRLWSERSPPHQSAPKGKGRRLFEQEAAGLIQQPLVNSGKRRKHIWSWMCHFLSCIHRANICVDVYNTWSVSGNSHSAYASYRLAKFQTDNRNFPYLASGLWFQNLKA